MAYALLQETTPILKTVPEIIKQASQSQLGILALLVIVLFGLASLFFKKAPVAVKVVVWLLVFSGVAAYAWEITRVASKPESAHYVGRVLGKPGNGPVSEALVSLLPAPKQQPWRTDSDGRFSFWVTRRNPSEDVQAQIGHEGYQPYIRTISSDESSQLGDIVLTPLAANAGTSDSSSGAPQLAGTPAPASAHDHTAIAATVVRPPSSALPPTAMLALAPNKVVSVDSGPKLSGARKEWSEWYKLSVGAAPEGYTVEKTEFWLSGDRSCGAWAECREESKNDQEVIWDFRLQGHDEWGAPPQAYSEGHLRVTYRRK